MTIPEGPKPDVVDVAEGWIEVRYTEDDVRRLLLHDALQRAKATVYAEASVGMDGDWRVCAKVTLYDEKRQKMWMNESASRRSFGSGTKRESP